MYVLIYFRKNHGIPKFMLFVLEIQKFQYINKVKLGIMGFFLQRKIDGLFKIRGDSHKRQW